jgi:hypothetical protein
VKLTTHGFDAHYHVERLDSCPRGGALAFRRPRKVSGARGLVLEVDSGSLTFEVLPFEGDSWVGDFEGGLGRTTGLFATPCANVICVVVKGKGFLIPVLAPTTFEIIRSIPINEVLAIPESGMLVFVDYTGLAAYGKDGLRWVAENLSWDGLKSVEVAGGVIRGMGWDSPANSYVPFRVDIESGAAEGGSSPAHYGVEPLPPES